MRPISLRIRLSVVALMGLLAAPAWAGKLTGQIKGERPSGGLTSIAVGKQFTVTRGGQVLLHQNGSPGYLQSLGAIRIKGAAPTSDGKIAVALEVLPRTPLARMISFMQKRGPAHVAGAPLPTEHFTVGGPGTGGKGQIGQLGVSISVLTGANALMDGYAKDLAKGRGLRAPSFKNYVNEPAR